MHTLLIAQDPDEIAILSLVLQRSGQTVTAGHELERALATWPDHPGDIVVVALSSGDPFIIIRQLRRVVAAPVVMIVDALTERLHYPVASHPSALGFRQRPPPIRWARTIQ